MSKTFQVDLNLVNKARAFSRCCGLPRSEKLLIVVVGLLAFAGCLAVGLLQGIPIPIIHDEFSYLLAADTFSHWRLSNPTHPMWIHFETMHVIHEPVYMSKYPPAQGLVLALGQLTTGYPIVGVWISMGLMCAAIFWMLLVWLTPRWALLGGVLVILHPVLGIAGPWAHSYWGGAIAATGGALVLGGLRSLMKKTKVTSALILGMGLALLANSRPYEGMLLSIPVAARLLYWLISKNGPAFSVSVRQILAPLCLVLGITAVGMAFYNSKITGHPFRLPYQVYEERYGIVPNFIWQSLRPTPNYHHRTIEEFHAKYGLVYYSEKQSFAGLMNLTFDAWWVYFLFAGCVVALPLIGAAKILALWIPRDRWASFATVTYLFFALGLTIETYNYLHYFAPIIPLNYFFVLQAMRLWRWRARRAGTIVAGIIPVLAIIVSATNLYSTITSRDELAWHLQRARLKQQLEHEGGQHLVIVKYDREHSFDHEWVYNEADIDGAKVVWARDMDRIENCKLVDYFKDRVIWSLNIERDDEPVKLNPFPRDSCP